LKRPITLGLGEEWRGLFGITDIGLPKQRTMDVLTFGGAVTKPSHVDEVAVP
jgi:hypothetical protein